MNAFYLIDKPIGMTSFDVLRVLKKKLGIKKMGHTGTLDPLASGLLLVWVGNYTKLIPFFEKDSKVYEFCVELNGRSSSYDSETEVIFLPQEKQTYFQKILDVSYISQILKQHFLGEISQTPPKYSAIKLGWQKAYDLARQGKIFEIPTRKVTIESIEILSFEYPKLLLQAKVSAGTYIRSIANDLGNILETWWFVSLLRRTQIGEMGMKYAQTLEDFDANIILPYEILFPKDESLTFEPNEIQDLDNGKKVLRNDGKKDGAYFVVSDGRITHRVEKYGEIYTPIRKI